MIFVDDRRIDFTSFPDGTSSIRIAPKLDFTFFAMGKSAYFIRWMYDNDAECMQLWYLVKHLKSAGNPLLYLEMPYIPNARMDRVKNRDEVFTLKWFAEFINSLGFESVKVLDPHSNVAMALIDRAEAMDVKHYIDYAIQWMVSQGLNPLLCYPDEGAAKRYSELLPMEYVFCIKHRDWRTGKIERLELTEPEKVNGRNRLFESQKRFEMFREHDFEIMYLNRRVSYFKNYTDQKPSLNPPFSSVYVCKGMLPKQIVFEEIQKTA